MFKRFHTFSYHKFSKQSFFEKLVYHFIAESITMENTTFPYKTTLLKTNVKIDIMVSRKWTYHKERGFTTLFFSKFNFGTTTSYK